MTVTLLRPVIATCAVLVLTASQPLDQTAAETSGGGTSRSAPAPTFRVDPFWPQELPDDWLLGNVVGVATDSIDNVWIIHRPNSQRGAGNTPPVIAFDPAGAVVHAWGGPGEGYDWGTQTHGLHVDHGDNVWVGFGGGLPYDLSSRATTDNAHVLKFTPEGEFLLQIGDFGRGTEGSGSTEFLGQPTDVFVDPVTDEVYISDGYTNRRVIVFDANTGEYRRHWSAYGDPPDDAPQPPFTRDGTLPRQFNHAALRRPRGGWAGPCLRPREPAAAGVRAGRHVRDRGAGRGGAAQRDGRRHPVGSGVLARSGPAVHLRRRRRQPRRPHAAPRDAWRWSQPSAAADAGPDSSSRPTAWPSIPGAICSSARRSMAAASRSSCRSTESPTPGLRTQAGADTHCEGP